MCPPLKQDMIHVEEEPEQDIDAGIISDDAVKSSILIRIKRFIYLKMVRVIYDSVHPVEWIARGAFIGTFVAMTPTFGLQNAMVIIVWSFTRFFNILRFNLVVGLAMTWITNYLTIFPIYFIIYFSGALVGNTFFGMKSPVSYKHFVALWRPVMEAHSSDFFAEIGNLSFKIGVPLFLASLLYGLVFGMILYILVKRAVIKYRTHKAEKMGIPYEEFREQYEKSYTGN